MTRQPPLAFVRLGLHNLRPPPRDERSQNPLQRPNRPLSNLLQHTPQCHKHGYEFHSQHDPLRLSDKLHLPRWP